MVTTIDEPFIVGATVMLVCATTLSNSVFM